MSCEGTAITNDTSPTFANGRKAKKPFSLPWWCVILGWVVLWLVVGICVAFVTFYGITFEDAKCKKWISSLLVSFLTSMLFTQPIKVNGRLRVDLTAFIYMYTSYL